MVVQNLTLDTGTVTYKDVTSYRWLLSCSMFHSVRRTFSEFLIQHKRPLKPNEVKTYLL